MPGPARTTDRETLASISAILNGLVNEVGKVSEEVNGVSNKLDHLKDGRLRDLDNDVTTLKERVSRLQFFVYGAIGLLATETIGLVVGLITWLIQKNHV